MNRSIRLVILAFVAPLAPFLMSACGGVYYAATVNAAASRLEHAREIGAETHAPYEYYLAKEHLKQAQVEASEASYGDAAEYAETAEEYANKAIEVTQQTKKAVE